MALDQGLWDINFTLTVGGEDLSEWVISMAYKSSLCAPAGTLEILFAPDMERGVIPYETIVINIDGTLVFTGYTQKQVKARLPISQQVDCEDSLSRVRDSWNFDQDLEANGESTSYWIGRFLNLAGVSYSVSGGGPPVAPKRWGVINCYQAIASMLKLVNWTMAVDPTGRVVIKNRSTNESNYHTVKHTSWERTIDDSWLRNRAVVLGVNAEASVDVYNYIPEIAGEIRTAILASPDIIWPGTAHAMANIMLNEFSTPLDQIVVECPGNPTINIGETLYVSDTWENHSRYGLITGLQWRINQSDGYKMTLSLDEKCPSFWMSDMEPTILYCALEGGGVWKSYDNGGNWIDISGEELSEGSPSYTKDIHVIKGISLIGTDDTVWAATLGGIFRTETGAEPWTNITDEYMDAQAQGMDWWGVQIGPVDHDKIYCLGNLSLGATEIYDDDGNLMGTIPAHTAILMYISLDGGETWISYQVNDYTFLF